MNLHTLRAWLANAALAALALALSPAWAQEDPPGRVGRLADLQGAVTWYDHEAGAWADAERNRPLTGGDRLSTGAQGRAELRVGSTVLRLGAASELEVLRLDDERMVFQLHSGSLALRVRSREVAGDVEVKTGEVRFRPERSGHYRFDRIDDTSWAGVWRGTLRIDDREGFILEAGQRAELWREKQALRFKWGSLPGDAFADWVQRDDQRDDRRSAANRYVSPEMTGAEDLDRAGRWERHPEYGAVWYPYEVRVDWAPYRYGRWIWVSPWGWTWVDEAPWGFAPFHYGRWVHWGGRWGWCPGDYIARPVYAPALVAWVGGPRVGVSITIGGPSVGWVPLAPREWYVPAHRVTPVYVERVNPRPPNHRGEWRRLEPVASGPVRYNNQAVPGGVTVVASDVLLRREPVNRHAADAQEVHRHWSQQPVERTAPPARGDVVRTEPPRAEAPRIEAPRTTLPRAELPREQPRVEVPRLEPPRLENPARVDRRARPEPAERGDRGEAHERSERAPRGERPAAAAVPAAPVAPVAPAVPAAVPARPAPATAPTAAPATVPPQVTAAPPPPKHGPPREERARDDERKRIPDHRGAKEERERREQQR